MSHSKRTKKTTPTILFVDDEPKVVDSLARSLNHFEVKFKKALHGMQGIWIAHTEKPDLVITDLKMPFANGEELVEVLNHVPVIVLTGISAPGTKERLLEAGAAAVLHKPVNIEQLVKQIRRFIPLEERSPNSISC